jgi:hypothetical protein
MAREQFYSGFKAPPICAAVRSRGGMLMRAKRNSAIIQHGLAAVILCTWAAIQPANHISKLRQRATLVQHIDAKPQRG